MELGDDDVRGGDTEGNALAVGLVADDTLDVDNPLETVDAGDLALTALVGATDNGDLVVLADGDRADLKKKKAFVLDSIPFQYCACNIPYSHIFLFR